jgi:hypothetical protein
LRTLGGLIGRHSSCERPLTPVGLVGLRQTIDDRLAEADAKLVGCQIRLDRGGQALLVAGVDDQVERLLHPFGRPLPAEIVQDQVLAAAQGIEELLEALRVFAPERSSERDEQEGDVYDHRGVAPVDQGAGDGDSEVGLSGAGLTRKREPPAALREGLHEALAHLDDGGVGRGGDEALE